MDRPLVVVAANTAAPRGAPHLIEIAALRVVEGEVDESFETLVCPQIPLDAESSARHGITEDGLRRAPLPPAALESFAAFAGEDWMAAHGAPAVAAALGYEYARAALEPPTGPVLDVAAIAARHLPEAAGQRLEDLAQLLELEHAERPGALADATLCWKVLEESLERAGGLAAARLPELIVVGAAPITISAARPGPARMSPRLRPLERARDEARVVRLLYGEHEGEAPVPLDVLPCFLFERGGHHYLEGECQSSGLWKTYRLDRVRRVLTDG